MHLNAAKVSLIAFAILFRIPLELSQLLAQPLSNLNYCAVCIAAKVDDQPPIAIFFLQRQLDTTLKLHRQKGCSLVHL